jgi:hypothetical protein
MQRLVRGVVLVLLCASCAGLAWGYIEVPYTLGKVVEDSTNIVLVEVTRVQKDKGLILFKKVKDLKGKYAGEQIKQNIGNGDRGFHPREAQNIMRWAAVGERAVFFCNEEASETCIGTYWHQCYREDQWWGMSHAEPYLLRTFCGDVEDLARAVLDIIDGKEVVVPCLVDANTAQLHQRKGKLQRLKASLKRLEYDAKRDFVAYGADGVEVVETRTDVLLPEGARDWRYLTARAAEPLEDRWLQRDFDDRKWKVGKAPIGYGEDEITNRKGTTIKETGQTIVFRRTFQVPAAILNHKDVTFQLSVAADNCARVCINGESVIDEGEEDHEFAYWNQTVDVPAAVLKPGRNVISVVVPNGEESSDLYLDALLTAETPVSTPKAARPKTIARIEKDPAANGTDARGKGAAVPNVAGDGPAVEPVVDKTARTVTIPARIALRKLPNLSEIYPLEVIATAPAPRGRKAHETVVTTDVQPSKVHAALESLGLKPGQPAKGEGAKAAGPEVLVSLQFTDRDGKKRNLPFEQLMVDTRGQKAVPKLLWHFTGSIQKQPDPEREETVYAADLSGTLISIFPVTNETVLQSHLTMADEPNLKLETDKAQLPAEGTEVNIIIKAK